MPPIQILLLLLLGIGGVVAVFMIWPSGPNPSEDVASDIIKRAESELESDLADTNADKNNPKNNPKSQIIISQFLLKYVYANLQQNRNIYLITLLVILGGFSMIGYGIWVIHESQQRLLENPGLLVLIAGILTEFVAAIILFMYRTLPHQSIEYFKALERMTAVTLSIQILDDLADDPISQDIRSNAKADVAKLLLEIQRSAVTSNTIIPSLSDTNSTYPENNQ